MSESTTPLRFHEQGEGWHLHPRRRLFFKAIGLAGLLVLAVPGFVALREGHVAAGVTCAVLGVALGVIPFADLGRRPLAPRRYETGLLLPTHPMRLALVLALAVLGPVILVGGIGASVEAMTQGEIAYGVIAVLVALAVGLVLCLGAYAGFKQRLHPDRGLLLTPTEVVLRNRREPARVPWNDIREVRAHWTRFVRSGWTTPTEQITNWISLETTGSRGVDPLRLLSGSDGPSVDVNDLGQDPEVVVALLRHYLETPDARPELADDRCLARVDAAQGAEAGDRML